MNAVSQVVGLWPWSVSEMLIVFAVPQFLIAGIGWLIEKIAVRQRQYELPRKKKRVPKTVIGNLIFFVVAFLFIEVNSFYLQMSDFGTRPWIVLSESIEYNEESKLYDITYQSLGFKVVYSTADPDNQEDEERYDRIANLYYYGSDDICTTWLFE